MDLESFDARIGEKIHMIMWRSGITVRQLAAHLGIDPAAASRRLKGTTSWKASEVMLAAGLLGVEVMELFPTAVSTSKDAVAESKCTAQPWGHHRVRIVPSDVMSGERTHQIRAVS